MTPAELLDRSRGGNPAGHIADLEALYTSDEPRAAWHRVIPEGMMFWEVNGGEWIVSYYRNKFQSRFRAADFCPTRSLVSDSLTEADAMAKCEMAEREFQHAEQERQQQAAKPTDADKLKRLLSAIKGYVGTSWEDPNALGDVDALLDAIKFAEQE